MTTPAGNPGLRIPWPVTLFSLVLAVVLIGMHGRGLFIDTPLIHLGPIPITTFGVLMPIAFGVFCVGVRNFVDKVQGMFRLHPVFAIVELIVLACGFYFIIQMVLYAFGWQGDILEPTARAGASVFRPVNEESP